MKKDCHQQLYDVDVNPETPVVGDSSSQGFDNLFDSDDLPGTWQKPPSQEEGEDEDEEPEAPPPVSHRALEKAALVSSETTHTTPTDRPTIAQKVPRKCPHLVPQEDEDEQDELPPTPEKKKMTRPWHWQKWCKKINWN